MTTIISVVVLQLMINPGILLIATNTISLHSNFLYTLTKSLLSHTFMYDYKLSHIKEIQTTTTIMLWSVLMTSIYASYSGLGLGTRLTSTFISIMAQLRLKYVRPTRTDSKANDFKPVLQLNC